MSQVGQLLEKYRVQVNLPWMEHLSPPERVWVAVYDPAEERRLRATTREFQLATQEAQAQWRQVDLTAAFSQWMNAHPYREAYFAEPHLLPAPLTAFEDWLYEQVSADLQDLTANSVVGVLGAGSLYGLTRVSQFIERVAPAVPGRMLLFFPGRMEGHNYRLLNARDGWNYHSVPLSG